MKNIKNIILSMVLSYSFIANAYADEGFIGSFKGTENTLLMSGCGGRSVNRSIGYWETKNTSTGENTFIGKVENRSGFSTYKGTITDNVAKGTVRGINRSGVSWSGVFTSKIDSDDYTLTLTGSIPSWGCRFRSEVQATRQ